MRKRKKKKLKRWVKIAITLLLIVVIILILMLINKIQNNNKDIELINNLDIELASEVSISDLIKTTKFEITNKNELLDTSNLGNQKIEIKYLKNDKEVTYTVKINIVDTQEPTIEVDETIVVSKNSNIALENLIKITDNSQEDIIPIIEGEYNLEEVGEYEVTIKAIDKSQNEAIKKIIVKVVDEISYNSDGSLKDGTYATQKGYTLKVENGIATVDDIVIVNKTYPLPSTYKPQTPYVAIHGGYCTDCIEDYVMEAFLKMQADAKKLGLTLKINSGYRSYETQVVLYNNYVSRDGKAAADTYSARAGYSEHQSGLCFDLNSDSDAFTNTAEGKWVNDNAYKYGLVIRFPKDKDEYTGYEYESWHLRYVGTELAEKLYNNGNWLSLEEYFGLTSKYPE